MGEPWNAAVFERDSAGDLYLASTYAPDYHEEDAEGTVRRATVALGKRRLDHVVCVIEVSSSQLGSIIVWGELSDDSRARAVMALEHGATVAALKMMERQSISQVEQQFRNEILEGLLSDQASARRNAAQASERLGNRLAPPFVVLIVGPDVAPDTLLAQKGRDERAAWNQACTSRGDTSASSTKGRRIWRRARTSPRSFRPEGRPAEGGAA